MAHRAEIVDFTVPVYTDHIMGVVPFKIKDQRDARIEPFHWNVWAAIASLPLMYLIIIALSECVFNNHVHWWIVFDNTLRPVFLQGVPKLPGENMYNRIFSITWIMMTYVMGVAYLGNTCCMIVSFTTLFNFQVIFKV